MNAENKMRRNKVRTRFFASCRAKTKDGQMIDGNLRYTSKNIHLITMHLVKEIETFVQEENQDQEFVNVVVKIIKKLS